MLTPFPPYTGIVPQIGQSQAEIDTNSSDYYTYLNTLFYNGIDLFATEVEAIQASIDAKAQAVEDDRILAENSATVSTAQAVIATAQATIAVNAVSSIPSGSINDSITTLVDANSSQFIADQLALKLNKTNPVITGSITEQTATQLLAVDATIATMQFKSLSGNIIMTDSLTEGQWCTILFTPNGFSIDVVTMGATWLTDVPTIGTVNKFLFEKTNGILYVSDAGKVA